MEKNCFNCKHDINANSLNCIGCGDLYKHWEAREETKVDDKKMPEKKSVEELKDQIKDLQAEIKRLEKYKQYDEGAQEMKALHDSLVRAGFTDDQAFTLLGMMLKSVANAVL